MTKNEQIKQTLLETRERRQNQILKVYELKVNCHHTSKESFEKLNYLFTQIEFSNVTVDMNSIEMFMLQEM